MRDRLQAEAERAERCQKAARDAWAFARAVMRSEKGRMPNPVADRLTERVLCRKCGQPFERVRPHQAFCRPSCRKADFDRRRERRPDLFLASADAIDPAVFDN